METSTRIFLNRWFLGILCMGILALICSLLAVHVFHLKPCVMCKMQRIPLVLLVVNAAFGLIGTSKEGFFRVTQTCLALGVILGIAPFLMQIGSAPDFYPSQRNFNSPAELSHMLQAPKCSETSWSVFGAPFSLLNAMFHGAFLWMSIRLKKRKRLLRSSS
jgi:disulfide bond formation protein DsbB